LTTALVERIIISEVLEELGYTNNEKDIEYMFKMIGAMQSDPKKYNHFFETTTAHFIVCNQVLFYDKTKKPKIGKPAPIDTEIYDQN